jgi:hypothetical protein
MCISDLDPFSFAGTSPADEKLNDPATTERTGAS